MSNKFSFHIQILTLCHLQYMQERSQTHHGSGNELFDCMYVEDLCATAYLCRVKTHRSSLILSECQGTSHGSCGTSVKHSPALWLCRHSRPVQKPQIFNQPSHSQITLLSCLSHPDCPVCLLYEVLVKLQGGVVEKKKEMFCVCVSELSMVFIGAKT